MKRVLKSFLTVGIATMMLGLVVMQARAERIIISGGCASLSCVPDSLTVNAGSLSFGGSSITVDTAAASSPGFAFAYEVARSSEPTVATTGAPTAAKVSVARDVKNNAQPDLAFLSNSMLWSFSPRAMNDAQSAGSMALPIANRESASFSVVGTTSVNGSSVSSAAVKPTGKPFHTQGNAGGGADPAIVGGPTVPEPATMLLFGTGLAGLAAVLRKRLRGRRESAQ